MSYSYKVVYKGAVAEIIEKKSRFIAYVEPVNTEEEASDFIDRIKKMNWDASHNCVAAVIGKNNEYSRCNDDGEPSGTAGKPMLEVLLGEDIHNVAVVVTRYFGGTLLGTGGLVRAYQKAVKEGLAASEIIERKEGIKINIIVDYNGIGKLQYIMAQMKIVVLKTEYSDDVSLEVIVPTEQVKVFLENITDATAGKACIETKETLFYGEYNGECILL